MIEDVLNNTQLSIQDLIIYLERFYEKFPLANFPIDKCPKRLLNNKEFIIYIIIKFGWIYQYISIELKLDKDIMISYNIWNNHHILLQQLLMADY
jgi:hypothetical protein